MSHVNVTNPNTPLPRLSRGSFSLWRNGFWPLAILIALLYTVLTWITPLYLDDWSYMSNWRDDVGNGSFSFSGLLRYAEYVRGYDNGRIPNMTAPLESMFSPTKDLFPIATGILLSLSIILVQKFAGKRLSPIRLAITWSFFILFLPWRDTLFANIYAYNYIWAGAINLIFLWFLKRGETRGWHPWVFFLTSAIAIVAGGWHESYAAATICGLALLIVIRKFHFSSRFYIICGIYFISTIFFMLSPGMIHRMESSIGISAALLPWRYYASVPLLLLIIVCNAFSSKGRSLLKKAAGNYIVITCLGIIVAGMCIGFLASNTMRSFYWPITASICLDLWFLFRMNFRISRICKLSIAWLLVIGCSAQTVSAIVWQSKYTHDWEIIISRLNNSPSGTVFFDSPNPIRTPRYTLGIPYSQAWVSPFHYRLLWHYYMTPTLGVVPTALRNASLEKATPLESNVDAYLYEGYVISPFVRLDSVPIIDPRFRHVEITMPDGTKWDGTKTVIPFVTERNDTLFYYTDI